MKAAEPIFYCLILSSIFVTTYLPNPKRIKKKQKYVEIFHFYFIFGLQSENDSLHRVSKCQ